MTKEIARKKVRVTDKVHELLRKRAFKEKQTYSQVIEGLLKK